MTDARKHAKYKHTLQAKERCDGKCFNVYIRFMLDELELSDVGCHKDHVYVGYLAYYIILLSASIRGLIIK